MTAPQSIDAHTNSPQPDAAAHQSVRVLVVDDDHDFMRALATLLEITGYDVRTAQDGLRGLDTVSQFRPQCAVLDVDLPGVDGIEIARRLRGHPWGRDVVLIAMTGWSRNEDRTAAMLAGFDHFLAKPVNLDELFGLLPPTRTAS